MDDRSIISCRCLDELLADPLIQLVMRADRVDAVQVRELCQNLGRQVPGAYPNVPAATITIARDEDPDYRTGVGIMLLNRCNEVLMGQRVGHDDAWQMPQGGLEDGETPSMAALRELREEIGTDNVELLAASRGWLRYDLPQELLGRAWGGRWRGQQQKWFAARFKGDDNDINIATEHPEFCAWRWMPASRVSDVIIAFKRQLYLDVLNEFESFRAAEPL